MVFAPVAFFSVLSSTRCGSATVRCVGYTSTRIVLKRLSSSFVPSVSLSPCDGASFAVIVRRGFSSANGSTRKVEPFWNEAGAVMPPVYAGMVPSLLAAFSAPTAVSVVPSCFASSAVTAAHDWEAMAEAARMMMDLRMVRILRKWSCR
jgi:hypothetical protein